jgi:hypothetical protein
LPTSPAKKGKPAKPVATADEIYEAYKAQFGDMLEAMGTVD